MDIGKGDWVEALRNGAMLETKHICAGSIWLVEAVEAGEAGDCVCCSNACPGLTLRGIDAPYPISGCCFRPIYRPRDSLIEALKAPPKRVKEVA